MAPKLQLPNATAIMWLVLFSLIRPVEANDVGNALALVVVIAVSMVGVCACLGWYARRRIGQLWGRLYPDAAIHRYIILSGTNLAEDMRHCDWLKNRAFNGINAKSEAESLKGAGKSIQEVRTQELLPCRNVSHSSIKDWYFIVTLKTVHIIFRIRSHQSGVVWKGFCFNARRCFLAVIKNFPVCMIDRRAVQSRFSVSSRALNDRFCYKFKKYILHIFLRIFLYI